MEDEPDLRPLLEQWVEAGITVVLPVVRERNAPLAFLPWTPDAPMRSGAYGIQEPAAGDELPPDVVLAPTLGFTPFGDRVGYGGSYYDRTLAALRRRPALHRHRHRLELRRGWTPTTSRPNTTTRWTPS